MAWDYLEEAKQRIAVRSEAGDFALIDIAESLRAIKEYVTPRPIQYTVHNLDESIRG